MPGFIPVVGDWDRDTQYEVGVFHGGQWYVDYGGRPYLWDGTITDRVYNFGFSGAVPVLGDWNGDTEPEIGVYNAGTWYLDANSNNAWDGTGSGKDAVYSFGAAGWTPVAGDWNRNGQTEIGVYTGGTWYLDANRNFVWDGTGAGKDAILAFGFAGAVPVTGDWNQDGILEIGPGPGILMQMATISGTGPVPGKTWLTRSVLAGLSRWSGTGPEFLFC
jgi:hypothetical protein